MTSYDILWHFKKFFDIFDIVTFYDILLQISGATCISDAVFYFELVPVQSWQNPRTPWGACYMKRQLPLGLWWLCLWFPRFLMTLSIVSVALMSLSIRTAMSGPMQQQGAERKGGLERNQPERHFDETLSLSRSSKGEWSWAVVQISGDRSGHTVTVSHSPTLYVCRGKSPRGVRAKPSLSRDLGSMIEKIVFLHFMCLSSQILHRDLNIVSARLSVHSLNVMYTIIPLATLKGGYRIFFYSFIGPVGHKIVGK